MNGVPSGFVTGRSGLPELSTTLVVGVDPCVVGAIALPLFQLSKYRKTPFRAQGVNTVTF